MPSDQPLSLFIPCLIDQVYPEMGFSMVRVLHRLGCEVRYRDEQTCCGQPAFNAGHQREAKTVARHFIAVFQDDEKLVCPSGSCTAMVRNFYPGLLGDAGRKQAGAVFEFSEYLARADLIGKIKGSFPAKIAFHNSCHSYRELGIAEVPMQIIAQVDGVELCQPAGEPVCCGFGGVFSVKFSAIAGAMADTRLQMFLDAGAEVVVSNDPGCIMHLRQECTDRGLSMRILHLAEFLDEAMADHAGGRQV